MIGAGRSRRDLTPRIDHLCSPNSGYPEAVLKPFWQGASRFSRMRCSRLHKPAKIGEQRSPKQNSQPISRRPFKNRSGKARADFRGCGVADYINPRKSSEQRSPERIFQRPPKPSPCQWRTLLSLPTPSRSSVN